MRKYCWKRSGGIVHATLVSLLSVVALSAGARQTEDPTGSVGSLTMNTVLGASADLSPERLNGLPGAVEEAKLSPNGLSSGDLFGYAVSLSGNRALIAAMRDGDNGSNAGAAYVFDYDGSSWIQSAKLTASDGASNEEFGFSVSLSGDRALISARKDDDNGVSSGSVYVFEFNGTEWIETAKLSASDADGGDLFGYAVSLSGDRALIGARDDDTDVLRSGSAYVFDYNGSEWLETGKLLASDRGVVDQFGQAVSLSGNRALVGAGNNDENGNGAGAAYVFEFDGSNWAETAKLLATDGTEFDFFGFSVSLAGDRALVGADREEANGSNSGAAYVFDFDGSSWNQTAKLLASDGAAEDRFGSSSHLMADRLIVGAYLADALAPDSGAAYVFDYDGSNWNETAKLVASDAANGDRLGVSVSASDNRVLAGAYFDDDDGSNSGSAYVFAFNQPPIAENDAFIAILDTPLIANLFVDNGNGPDSDPDGDSFVVQAPGNFTADGIGGTVDLAADGDFTYTPPAGVLGIATFDYSIEDPSGATDSATVTIDVRSVEVFEDRFEQ